MIHFFNKFVPTMLVVWKNNNLFLSLKTKQKFISIIGALF